MIGSFDDDCLKLMAVNSQVAVLKHIQIHRYFL